MTDLGTLTWSDADLLGAHASMLLIPLGATEQHGPHLPLHTDSAIAVAIASVASTRLDNSVVAPVVPYGSSGEHQAFPGSLSIGADVTELLIIELARSATCSFNEVILVSTHGGNDDPVRRAVKRLRSEQRNVRAWAPRWGGDAHAGRTETSLMLALDPDNVRICDAEAGNVRPLSELIPALRIHGVRSVSPNGVLGDPSGATFEEGQALLASAVDQLIVFAARGMPTEHRMGHRIEQTEHQTERPTERESSW